MNASGDWAEGFATARQALASAMAALKEVSSRGFILVGAQAVYLRAGHIRVSMPAFTFDGDIVADPRYVRSTRLILEKLEAVGFTPRGYGGLYKNPSLNTESVHATHIDVFVPERFENDFDLAGISASDSAAVMSQAGLELTLFDHSTMEISASDKTLQLEVAGIASLVIAKAWKIYERYEQGQEAFADVAKDVIDVFRLLRASEPEDLAATFARMPGEPRVSETAHIGAKYLLAMCGREGPGLRLVTSALGNNDESLEVVASLSVLTEELHSIVLDNI